MVSSASAETKPGCAPAFARRRRDPSVRNGDDVSEAVARERRVGRDPSGVAKRRGPPGRVNLRRPEAPATGRAAQCPRPDPNSKSPQSRLRRWNAKGPIGLAAAVAAGAVVEGEAKAPGSVPAPRRRRNSR